MQRDLPPRAVRALCIAVLAGLVFFCAAMAVASALYPGGTWFDRSAESHRFWENFWCDLLRARGHNGAPNVVGSRVALAGWLVLSATLAAFWTLVPRLLDGLPRLAGWVGRLGPVSALAMVGIFLTPSDAFPKLHGIVITIAAGPGLGALALSVWALGRRAQPSELRVSGWALVTFATLNFAVYSFEYWLDRPGSQALPAIQKLATFSAIAWMALVVRRIGQSTRLHG